MQGAGAALVQGAIKQLEKAFTAIGSENEGGIAVMDAIKTLRKHFPADGVTPGQERASQEQFMLRQRQENPLMNVLRATGQQQQPQPQTPPGATLGMPQM